MAVPRHDKPHPGKRMKGSGDPRVDDGGTHTLPFLSNCLELRPARQSLRAGERP
jgi:hypothetical protein